MKRVLILFLLIFSMSVLLTAQKTTKYSSTQDYKLMGTVEAGLTHEQFFSAYAQQMGFGPDDEMILEQQTKGLNGYVHYKYTQEYRGVPIFGKSYMLHTKNGEVRSANGSFASWLDLVVEPTLTAEEALQIAILDMDADEYPWEAGSIRSVVHTEKPIAELCIIDQGLTQVTGHHKLVHRIDLYSSSPIAGQQYFIDAHTGRVVQKVELLHTCCGVPGHCETRYYGTQELIVDSISANNYVLFDETRGQEGLGVVDFDGTFFSSNSRNFDSENDGFQKGAMDAHYCATKFYDVMEKDFDWLGLDGSDASLKIGVFANGEDQLVNAFWNGEMAWIGNGNCHIGPLATLEIVAHEFMHGIIDYTSKLIYYDESGAINESMADVAGQVLEFLADEENFSWNLDASFINDQVEPFRIMDDPNSKEHPALYKGEFWLDEADVHINSSIGNLLYVLLADGRQGKNELGDVYNITGMGKLEAAQFIFHVNRNYLSPSSDYEAYYQASLMAAEEWTGGDEIFLSNLIEAWAYLGISDNMDSSVVDLAIFTSGYNFACGFKPFSPKLGIYNTGQMDYITDRNAKVVVSKSFGEDESVVLAEVFITDTILVGETLTIQLDSVIVIDKELDRIDYRLEFEDQSNSNNATADFIYSLEFMNDDLSISLSPTFVDCFETEAELEFILTNQSCEAIERGTELTVVIRDINTGDIFLEENVVTERRIWSTGYLSFVRPIEVPQAGIQTILEAQVIYKNDPSLLNNLDSASFSSVSISSGDYFNGFDDQSTVFESLGLATASDIEETLVNFNQESYFRASGIFEDSDDIICLDAADIFKSDLDFYSGIASKLTACVDLSNDDQPSVNFNLIQFRNEEIQFPSLSSSALEVSWGDGGNDPVYIYGQEEGKLVHHQIALPPNYRGPLRFSFFTLTGDDSSLNLFDSDSQLLDNLHFGNDRAEKNPKRKQINVFPNPAYSSVFVASTGGIETIRIIDMKGRVVHKDTRPNINISHLVDGYYRLEVLTEQGEIYQESLIIVKR